MKVLVITNDFPPKVGGINYYVAEIVRRFPPGEITVFASWWPGAEALDATFPHGVIRWPSKMLLPTPQVTKAVLEIARDQKPDILLFGASLPLALIGIRVRERLGVPYAAFTHGLEIAAAGLPLGQSFLRRVGRTAALLTTVSRFVQIRLQRFVNPPTRLELLPAGVDAKAFQQSVSGEVIRSRHGLGEGPILCCVSRLVARKGQDQVIRALPELAAEWPGIRFLVVGAGPYERTLRRLAARVNMSQQVVFAGEVAYQDLPGYFRTGDVFVMPCRSRFRDLETEALGAVYLQAAAVGRPSIGGNVGGAPEAVRHGQTGLVVDGRSVVAVQGAIRELLRDPNRALAMGSAGAAWVHRELTWDIVAARARTMLLECSTSGSEPVSSLLERGKEQS